MSSHYVSQSLGSEVVTVILITHLKAIKIFNHMKKVGLKTRVDITSAMQNKHNHTHKQRL